MEKALKRPTRDPRQLHQLIAELTDGIILMDLAQSILWASNAALAMHGVKRLTDLGKDIDGYRRRFR